MSKRLLWGIIAVLFITNVATLLFVNRGESTFIDGFEGELSGDDAVATISGEDITYAEWMGNLHDAHGEKQLKSMVDRTVVNRLAEEKKVSINEKVIERDLAYLVSIQGPMTEDEYLSEEEKWRNDIIYRYQLEFLLTEDIPVSEKEIEVYYEEYKNQYDFKKAMQLSHIIVENMGIAEKVYSELEEGASFDFLAQEYSLDEDTKRDGGYLGFINTDSQFFPQGYEEVSDEVEEHSYSKPFVADNGIALIYLHQSLPAIEFTYEEIKPYVKNELALHNEQINLNADSLWEEIDVDWIYSD